MTVTSMNASPTVFLAVLLSGCAIAPVTLRQLGHRSSDDMHALLEKAMAEPETKESKDALAHFITRWKDNSIGTKGLVSSSTNDRAVAYQVSFSADRPGTYSPGYFDQLLAAEDFDIQMMPHHRRPGAGVTLMALRENRGSEPIERFYPP